MISSSIKSKALIIISFISIVMLWEMAAKFADSAILLPSPLATLKSLCIIITEIETLTTVLGTTTRWLISILISYVFAMIFGSISGLNKSADTFFRPYLHIIMATPVMSIILIALIWFDKNIVPMFVCFLVCFPILCNNVISGVRSVDLKLVEMAKVYNISKARIMIEIYFPSMLPFVFSGMRTAMGLGWKVIVVAEVISQPKFSIGSNLYDAKVLLETDLLFAWTVLAVVISFLFDKIIKLIEATTVRWKKV